MINEFVEKYKIKTSGYHKPDVIEPQKGGEKAYALWHKARSASGRLGVAKVAIQKREYLAAVKPDGLFLILELMHFAQEVLEPSALNSGADRTVSPQELKMATALIDAMTSDWDPTKYQDQYQNALMQLIEEKAQKRAPAPTPRGGRARRGLGGTEESSPWGVGAGGAAGIGERGFDDLDAPVRRVAATDTPVAYEPGLERAILPQVDDILAGAVATLDF